MRKIIYLSIWLYVYFVATLNVKALTYGGCDYSEVSKLKSYVSNINLSYDYYISDDVAYFNITLNNIVPSLYFIDSSTGIKYTYYDTNDGEITLTTYGGAAGHYDFYSALNECYGIKLGNKYYNLPSYNSYYNDPLCKGNEGYNLCQKWVNVNYSYEKFSSLIKEYNKNKEKYETEDKQVIYETTYLDKFVEFYVKYYYIILIGIIAICITIMVISHKKNKFDL